MAGLGLRPDVELGGAGHVRAGPLVGPWRRVETVAHGSAHQRMPGGMEFHLVDPVAPAVVAAQHRRMLVGEPGLLAGDAGAGQAAERVQVVGGPVGPFPANRLQQGGIVRDVVADQRRHLVADVVCGQVCRPHSVLPVPAQRPLRGSAPGATRMVQVAQPIDG